MLSEMCCIYTAEIDIYVEKSRGALARRRSRDLRSMCVVFVSVAVMYFMAHWWCDNNNRLPAYRCVCVSVYIPHIYICAGSKYIMDMWSKRKDWSGASR